MFGRKERHVMEIALRNYKTLWEQERSTYQPQTDVAYIDANLNEFRTIIEKIKSEKN